MARTLREARLSTRSVRVNLPQGLYWRGIDADIHLGYRKGRRGGKWLVRYYVKADRGSYRHVPLGVADDVISDGTLSYDEAVKLARRTVAEVRRGKAQAEVERLDLTIRSCVEAYVAMRDERTQVREGRAVRSDASYRLERHILLDKKFSNIRLDLLSEEDISGWKRRLSSNLKISTKKRLFNDLKAALNGAYRDHRRRLPSDFPELVRHGLRVDSAGAPAEPRARENQILADAQIRKIIETAMASDPDGDFARMILVLAATGARFSQVKRITVADVQAEHARLIVPSSRKGRERIPQAIPVQVGQDVLSALTTVTTGRAVHEPLLCRWRHVQIGPIEWKRDSRGPWQTASELRRPWLALCDTLGLKDVVPYALRHSSIVRAIRSGLPIRLVAAMHDTSVVMIERHYSRWIVDGLEELAARAVIPLVAAIAA